MPSMTLGGMMASVLQFIVIVGILSPVLVLTTIGGGGVLTPGFANSFNSIDVISNNGVITNNNAVIINTGGPNSITSFYANPNGTLQLGLTQITGNNSKGISGGILSSTGLGGLAFIPVAFGTFITLMFRSPFIMLSMFSTLLTPGAIGSGQYIDLSLIASMTIISGAFMAYCIAVFAMKMMSPIVKVELEDV